MKQKSVSCEADFKSVADKHDIVCYIAHGLSPEEAVDVIVKGILR